LEIQHVNRDRTDNHKNNLLLVCTSCHRKLEWKEGRRQKMIADTSDCNSMLTWKANYSEKESLSQFNADGSENSYKDIDRSKLFSFEMLDGDKRVYVLFLHEGQRLIFRRRNWINLNGKIVKQVYLVGYQFTDSAGKNYQVINYVHDGGYVELDDDRKDLIVHPEEI